MIKRAVSALLVVLGFVGLVSCSNSGSTADKKTVQDTVYTVSGTIQDLDSGLVRISYFFDTVRFTDTARVNKGAFQFHGKVNYPQFAHLTIEDQPQYGGTTFFLDNGTTQVSAKRDSLALAVISGTPTQDEYRMYVVAMKSFEERMSQLELAYENIPKDNYQKVSDSLLHVYNEIVAGKLIAIKEYIRTHPESFVAAVEVLNNFYYNPKVDQLDSVYGFLGSNVKASPFGKKIFGMVEIARKTDIGKEAPDFSLNDVNGKPLALSSVRGKVVLLDFWASWCGPCREENPNVVAAYGKYHPKGFEIFSVSLDTDKDKWLKAIKEDKLTWKHVSDLEGWASSAGAQYGIKAIPMSYLLDKDGKIIAKNLRGSELGTKLGEILK